MALRTLMIQAKRCPDSRFSGFLDSQVARGALSKGRSSSHALQPLCRRSAAIQTMACLYPVWNFAPTRLNVADDPTRDAPIRCPLPSSLLQVPGIDFLELHSVGLRRSYANWIRLTLLLAHCTSVEASPLVWTSAPPISSWIFSFIFSLWTSLLCCALSVLAALSFLGGLVLVASLTFGFLGQRRRKLGVLWALTYVVFGPPLISAMEPMSAAEKKRAGLRAATTLVASRTVKAETRLGRQKLLEKFSLWLYDFHKVSLSTLLAGKPADPEEICKWLVLYGQDMFSAGKSYTAFSETINAVAVSRPLIRKQLTPAWDLAFAWLCDEPHAHHPALPLSVMLAMLSTCLLWGWPLEAGVIALTWNGILRIGETLQAQRKDLILPSESMPGVDFLLLNIKTPKTRGRSAKHQSARVDPKDMIELITGVFGGLNSEEKLWPLSAATLRKRFNLLLAAIGLPDSVPGAGRGFDLGSLLPGGATHLLLQTEDPELCRRRGRWLSSRVMEIYLQEVIATTYIQKIHPTTKQKVVQLASAFPKLLRFSLQFLATAIPPKVWPMMFQTQGIEELG